MGRTSCHGNIKSSNILLLEEPYYACVSEHGLFHLLANAPEGDISQEADVYSFGMILLELLTSKPPRHAIPDLLGHSRERVDAYSNAMRLLEAFDPVLLRNYQYAKDQMLRLLRISMNCLDESCYVDCLLAEEQSLTEEQMISLVWDAIIETSDTTLVTTEWAMYELSKNPKCQEHLCQEIQEVCGSEKLTEERLPILSYLNVVFHETLRYHSHVPIILPRHVHEDTQLGGYNIPAGTDITINLYACNMDKIFGINPMYGILNDSCRASFISRTYTRWLLEGGGGSV